MLIVIFRWRLRTQISGAVILSEAKSLWSLLAQQNDNQRCFASFNMRDLVTPAVYAPIGSYG
jgi:hypothetical protein